MIAYAEMWSTAQLLRRLAGATARLAALLPERPPVVDDSADPPEQHEAEGPQSAAKHPGFGAERACGDPLHAPWRIGPARR